MSKPRSATALTLSLVILLLLVFMTTACTPAVTPTPPPEPPPASSTTPPSEPTSTPAIPGMPRLIYYAPYSPGGAYIVPALTFIPFGMVDLEDEGYLFEGFYAIEDDILQVIIFEEIAYIFQLGNDPFVMTDLDSGEIFAVEDSLQQVLEYNDFYFLGGDDDALAIWFWSDGEVDIFTPGIALPQIGHFSIEGTTVTVLIEGEEPLVLEVINSFLLLSGEQFYMRIY